MISEFDMQASIHRLTIELDRVNALPCATEKQCTSKKILLNDITRRLDQLRIDVRLHIQQKSNYMIFERHTIN
jgi:hypothetical protein